MTDSERQLVDLYLDGVLPETEHALLFQRLETDPEALVYLASRTQLNVDLRRSFKRRKLQQTAVAGAATSMVRQPRSVWFSWRTSALIASAAAVVLLAFIVWPRAAVDNEAISNGVAMVSDTLDADFAETAVRSGDTIAPGKLTLNKGLAQIEFFSGATVLIEGATQIEILSAWEARCVSGRVRVRVPPAAKGFLMHRM
jgi:anti-sigma factor RsiW